MKKINRKMASLNDLPDHILLHILSSLPTIPDAIETSFLSRKWRNLWLSIPSLNFSCHCFSPIINPPPSTLKSFVDFVGRALILRHPNSPLLSFQVQFDFSHPRFTPHVDSWIRFAVSNKTQILDFNLYDYFGRCHKKDFERNEVNFVFPFYVLRDSKVRVLKLSGCDISLPSQNAEFRSLRSISLESIVMTDQMIVDLMAACVNVESLVLSSVRGCKDFKICSSKLRELTLQYLLCDEASLEIVTPNLVFFSIICFHVGNYDLRDVSSLVEANVVLLYSHCWLKVIRFLGHVQHLTSPSVQFELPETKDDYLKHFILQNLKYVELGICYTKPDLMCIAQLLVLSPNLQTMIVTNSPVLPETYDERISEDFIKQLSLNLPSLRHFKMKSFMGTDCEFFLLFVLLKSATMLERIVLIPKVEGTPQPPIVLDPQANGLQDFKHFCSQYPKQKSLEERIN